MVSTERVTLFGDLKGINVEYIHKFIEATDHLYGGSYPSRQEDLTDEEVEKRARELLFEVGVSDCPIALCNSVEERATKILQECSLRRAQNGKGLYWIVDSNPHSFVEAINTVMNTYRFQADILRSTTVIMIGSHAFDYLDAVTGIRVAAFPTTYHFPTHPTPAS